MAGRGVNKVILVGNVGRDPETRYTKDNVMVVNLTLATSDSWFDRNTNSRQERTEWHRLVFFGKLAEIVDQYVTRGQRIYVEGQLQTRKWEDQRTGQDRFTTEIIGSEMVMLSGRDDPGQHDSQPRGNSGSRYSPSPPSQNTDSADTATDMAEDIADDLPW